MKNKGWLKIPGVQDGARTLQEQMLGLAPALDETPGKTVLDLGCAEGLIALEFAKAGARSVYGIDYNATLIDVARAEMAKSDALPVEFKHADLTGIINARRRVKYDIVLALAVLHKLPDPAEGLRFCAQSARSLIVVRLPYGSTGNLRAKHAPYRRTDIREILPACGFVRERKEPGPRGEWVQYWRRA